jgi:hypothetical protein
MVDHRGHLFEIRQQLISRWASPNQEGRLLPFVLGLLAVKLHKTDYCTLFCSYWYIAYRLRESHETLPSQASKQAIK